ncbi:uncharacterized protein (DUF849 family) [Saccharomonospora amisosensis]|uniref:Uncharacterized protein (DUF849 family) n=1 Tax=Saccharomonospora amisosensis TaxID=1128677 RepID=A0A7X5ZT55_9PSEU|nr:3-keto-5-aminohexanoate cleavage protein [Saccharomonospora amisosensis]NIJ14276.1 uncharacterized protein (DUF849 family) [Saccharomonospora amisosensis]
MFLQVCLNGARRRVDHPRLPCTPAALAADARECRAAGAESVHLHSKDHSGFDTLDREFVDEAVARVRSACPGLPIGLTTGAWILPEPGQRLSAVRSWTHLPDFASVNWHEDGADEVASTLLERGIAIEAGLWHEGAVEAWLRSPLRENCARVLLELPAGLSQARVHEFATRMLTAIRDRAPAVAVLLHGEDDTAWPALDYAVSGRLATRIGFEDTLRMPDGSIAACNAALVEQAARRVAQARRLS